MASETAAATTSLAARVPWPSATSDSRSIIHAAASVSGAGECRLTGGASMPKSYSACRYTSATIPVAARGTTGVTYRI